MIYRRGSLHGQAYHSTGTADRANEPHGGLIREQDYYPWGIITIVIRAPKFTDSTRKFNEYVVYHITDYRSARRFALTSAWWSTNGNHFFRTEAIALLKTNDRSRDRTQHEPISEVHQGGRQKGAALRKMGQVVWLMSMYTMMGAAALFREEETDCGSLGVTLVKRRIPCMCRPEKFGKPALSGKQSALALRGESALAITSPSSEN